VLSQRRLEIQRAAREAELIVVSHFHHDHFMPFFENYALFWSNPEDAAALYQQHRVWCKDIRNHVNWSQQGRGYDFIRKARDIAREVVYADGRALKQGATTVRFSPAVPHGEANTDLGWVIMTAISHQGATVVHASDIQGPMVAQTVDWILSQKPQVLLLAGPPTYLSPGKVAPGVLAKAAENLTHLAVKIPTIIVDHHLLRDSNWRSWVAPVQTAAEANGHHLTTMAGIRGLPEQLLEAQRSQLYANDPPKPDYSAWTRGIQSSRTRSPPPLET
jgi:predicted metallo-beta-lactamase superfamily hydrolase